MKLHILKAFVVKFSVSRAAGDCRVQLAQSPSRQSVME